MKKLYFLLFAISITAFSFGQQINEFQPNAPGADPDPMQVELKGTPSAAFSGWILGIESDASSAQGMVDRFSSVSGTFDANGLLVVTIPDLENPSFTLVLVSSFTGDNNTDIDTDNDGVVDDISTFGTIYDAIGIPDTTGEAVYGAELGGADFAYTGDEPQLAFRDGTTGDWYAVNDPSGTDAYDINGNAVAGSSFDTDPTGDGTTAATSFGSVNPSNLTASVNDFNKKSFNIFPNPTSTGSVTIVSSSASNFGNIKVAVYDVLGKQVINKVITGDKLNVSALNTGVYIMKLSQGNAISTKKLVIK
jgi:hypothetical protein